MDIDVRPPLIETAHHLGQHLVGDALVDPDAQAARHARRVRSKVRLCRAQARLDRHRVTKQDPPGLGQLYSAPAPRAFDQPLPDERLQRAHVIADRGQGRVQLL